MTTPLFFEHVGKRFEQTVVLSDIHFETGAGELVVLVGPSGCGKSTLLRCVAGLETITEGAILAGNRLLNDVPPQDRGVGMVFQSYALYPHMTVEENLAFPLHVKKVPLGEQRRVVGEAAELLGLAPLLKRFPRQLSGGQRQRVAIGRCLVRKPEIYCFDEPLSNLDAALRAQIRVDIKALQGRLKKTMLYVTHDQVEAMTLADRIVVLNRGIVQQVGSPKELYRSPANRFVARFIGTPSMNLARGRVASGLFSSGSLACPLFAPDGETVLGVRVEDVQVLGSGSTDGFPARVEAVEPVGESGYLHLRVEGAQLEGDDPKSPGKHAESETTERRLVASVPGHAAFGYRPGDEVLVRLGADRVHAFDAATGVALPRGDRS